MRKVCILAAVSVVCLFSSTAQADGLIYQLPEDGAWVRFDLVITSERDGMERTMTGSLTMSSVGRTQENGEDCRWIEFKLQMKRNEAQRTTIAKVLIPEKFLKKGENPLEHAVRVWEKQGDNEPRELEDPQSPRTPLPAFFSGPLKEVKKLDKEVVESKLGKLECEGLTGHNRFGDDQMEINVTYHTRLHAKAPFGVVTCRMDFEEKRDGNVQETGYLTLKLADFGEDAQSDLPGYQ